MQEKINLPIGSVVKIKNEENLLMITGYMVEHENKKYDYNVCVYPDGILSLNELLVIKKDQIEKVIYEGYKNSSYELLNNIINKRYR